MTLLMLPLPSRLCLYPTRFSCKPGKSRPTSFDGGECVPLGHIAHPVLELRGRGRLFEQEGRRLTGGHPGGHDSDLVHLLWRGGGPARPPPAAPGRPPAAVGPAPPPPPRPPPRPP